MSRRAFIAAIFALSALPALAQSRDPSFRIVNETQEFVNEVYASPSNTQSWGHDRLGTEVIRPGTSHIIRLPSGGDCRWDVRIVYRGGASEERRNLDLCNTVDMVLGTSARAPAARNPSFTLVNRSRRTIEQFYASPSSQQSWGNDRLGSDMVGPGQRYPVRLPSGECVYDLRVVFQGGDAQERRRVDTCNITDYEIR